MTTNTIPSLSLSRLACPDLTAAFEQAGAVRITDALDSSEAHECLRALCEAFALPEDIRLAYRRTGMQAGYTPPGVETVQGYRGIVGREFWDMNAPEHAPLNLPAEAPNFSRSFPLMYAKLESLARILFLTLDAGAATDAVRLADISHGGQHLLRANWYPACEPGLTVFPDHVDFGLLTFYLGGSTEGLQWLVPTGNWKPVENLAGSVVAGVGTTLRMFRRSFRTLRHRVCSNGQARISAAFFAEPRPEIILPNARRETAGEHLARIMREIRNE